MQSLIAELFLIANSWKIGTNDDDKRKQKEKEKKKKKKQKMKHIEIWLKNHKLFSDDMEELSFCVRKGMFPEKKLTAELVKKLLKEHELKPVFKASEILEVWKGLTKKGVEECRT